MTAQRVNDLNPVPEPASIIVWLAIGVTVFIAPTLLRRKQAA